MPTIEKDYSVTQTIGPTDWAEGSKKEINDCDAELCSNCSQPRRNGWCWCCDAAIQDYAL